MLPRTYKLQSKISSLLGLNPSTTSATYSSAESFILIYSVQLSWPACHAADIQIKWIIEWSVCRRKLWLQTWYCFVNVLWNIFEIHARGQNTIFVKNTEVKTLTAFHGCSDSMSLIRKRCSVSMSTIGKRYSVSISTMRKRYTVSMSTIRKRYADSISMIRKRCSIFRDLQHKNFFVFFAFFCHLLASN